MSSGAEYIVSLIEYTVSSDNVKPDLETCLEIGDRANSGKIETVETIKAITKMLSKSNPRVILNTLLLLETLCKNANMRFIAELNNKKLVDALLKILQKRRDLAKFGSKIKPTTDKTKIEAEDKVLYLLQLWADTFMMHEEDFKNIHEGYRTLRKEGVRFPERDPNNKYMINFQGQISPIFLAMEKHFIPSPNNQGGIPLDPNKRHQNPQVIKPEYKHEYVSSSSVVQNTLYDDKDEKEDNEEYDIVEVSKEEIKVLEESLNILREIEWSATRPADMKTETARELLNDLVHVKKRLTRFLQTEKFNPDHFKELTVLREKISSRLHSYKNRYNISFKRENFKMGIPTEPLSKLFDKEAERNKAKNDRLRTEGFEDSSKGDDAFPERFATEESKDTYDPTKRKQPLKKAEIIKGKGLAPPPGWAVITSTENTGPNPDYIDLLSGNDEKENNVKSSNENSNKITPPNSNLAQQTTTLLDDLLSVDLTGNSHKNNSNNGNSQVPTGQNSLNGFNFAKNNSSMPTVTVAQVPKKEEDDDFFAQIANRK